MINYKRNTNKRKLKLNHETVLFHWLVLRSFSFLFNSIECQFKLSLTSNLSERGIFCCATCTVCGTTGPSCEATAVGSGPSKVGTRCPAA